MLGSLRAFVGSWAAKVLLVLLVGSFALWGVSGSILGGTNANTIAQVGETNVTIREFLATYNRSMNEMQQRIGRRLTQEEGRMFGVEANALSNVVAFAALDEYARQQSLSLSDDTLAHMLAENPQFRDSTGKFNRDTFRRAVYDAQMRESDYIALQDASAIRGQVMQSFATDGILPQVFTDAMGEFVNEERKFTYMTISPKEAGTPPAATDEQLKTYFEANLKKYAAPEFRKLELLKIEPADLADESSILEEDIKADYESRLDSYRTPEKRRIQQIVFKSKELADAAVTGLSEGKTFEAILADNELTVSDADLGLLAKAQLPEATREAGFSLELNKPSDLLEGPFGPTMIRVTEITEESTQPIEDVRDEIRKDLALRKATEELLDVQERVEDSRAGGTALGGIGKQLGVDTRLIDSIDRTARTPDLTIINDIPSSSDLLDQAFQTEVGAQASPLDVGNTGYVWYDVLEVMPARDRTFEEVVERVRTDWTVEEQAKMVTAKAEELKKRLEGGASMDAIALEFEQLAATTELLKRNGQTQGFPNAAVVAGFSGGADSIAIADSDKAGSKLLISVAERKGLEAQLIEVPKEQIEQANRGAADDLLNQMIGNLQNTYSVTHNPTLINQVLTQGY
ncbi:MAG: SurA N-terminal domain-containing protein [Rhizobiaceae bacterium]